jgi:hypothetical protein
MLGDLEPMQTNFPAGGPVAANFPGTLKWQVVSNAPLDTRRPESLIARRQLLAGNFESAPGGA